LFKEREVGDDLKYSNTSPIGLQITSHTRVPKLKQMVPIDVAEQAGYEVDKHVALWRYQFLRI
jgi:hypothetical protein